VGENSLWTVSTGSRNTAVGVGTGGWVTTGTDNTFLGYGAGSTSGGEGLIFATAIGAGAVVSQSNALALGGTGQFAVNVGIGTPTPSEKLQVVGDIRIGTGYSWGCLYNFDGSSWWGVCSSDARLKRDIRPFDPVLGRVVQLQPVRFRWRADEFPDRHFGNGLNSGLIAQDVEKIFPELVSTDDKGYKTVNYAELPYLTLAAVKELKVENDALKAQLAALADRLARLETRDRH
jgi:hypothetical protein